MYYIFAIHIYVIYIFKLKNKRNGNKKVVSVYMHIDACVCE